MLSSMTAPRLRARDWTRFVARPAVTLLTLLICSTTGGLAIAQPASASPAQVPASPALGTKPWACPSGMPAHVTCGRLDVPLDWSDPASARSVSIAFAVHRATDGRIGTLTFNPGGPGQSGVDALGFMLGAGPPAMALPQQVVEHFDIVAWDPRGVGYSGPELTDCGRTDVAMDPIPQVGPIPWKEVAKGYAKRLAKVLRVCADANPEVAAHLGTAAVIDDLEALRQALQVEQWTYLGTSYGTTIGMAYARAHPDRIRAMVLDGVAPPSQTLLQAAGSQAQAWRAALDAFAAEYPKAGALTQLVIDALDNRVLEWRQVPFTRFPHGDAPVSLYGSLSSYLQNERRFPALRDLIFDLAGQLDDSSAAADASEAATFTVPVNPIVSLVLCADRPNLPTIAQAAELALRADRKGLAVAGIPSLERSLWCAGLGDLGRPLDASTAPIVLPTPPLVLNAIGDMKTPMARARVAVEQLPGSRLITYLGTIHGLYPRAGSDCVNAAVTDYLINLRLPATDLTCPIPVRAGAPAGG